MKPLSARIVEPELLDELSPQDLRALRSRRDLRRVNRWMDHPRLMAHALSAHLNGSNCPGIVELGAGDGHFLLNVARQLQPHCPTAQATLVDRLDSFDSQIQQRFKDLGWRIRLEIKTASDWLRESANGGIDIIICNLFLHQFRSEELSELLRLAAHSARLLIALEPRRSQFPRFCGRLLWIIGCGPVTRHDASVSIRAGFYGRELSALWSDTDKWVLTEHAAGFFSHLFIARRTDH